MKSVLFICHGNICRSPMAEFIFKDMVRKAGLEEVRIDSAAVSYEEEGNDIYPPAKRTLHGHGIPFGRHSAHRVTDAEASEYDVIIVMDASNRRLLSRIISPMNMSGRIQMSPILGTPEISRRPTGTSPKAAPGFWSRSHKRNQSRQSAERRG